MSVQTKRIQPMRLSLTKSEASCLVEEISVLYRAARDMRRVQFPYLNRLSNVLILQLLSGSTQESLSADIGGCKANSRRVKMVSASGMKDKQEGEMGNTRGNCRAGLHADMGFTLLELLVVMVIIGLLASFVGPRYFSQIGKSEVKTAKGQMDSLEKALDQYRLDVGKYPSTEQGLVALVSRPANEAKWDGPYLKKALPPDPWGNPYGYKFPGEHSEFDIWSFGRDGQPGGTSENEDIKNW